MKNIGQLLKRKTTTSRSVLDEKSVFYIFSSIIKEEYGRQGSANIAFVFFRDRKIALRAGSLNWENEIRDNSEFILEKLNEKIGDGEVREILILQ